MSDQTVREIVFVVDVTSFTENGFVGSTTHRGTPVKIEFDDQDKGVTLTREMCNRLGVKKGSLLTLIGEDDNRLQVTESTVASVGDSMKISNAKIYYFIGRSGGGVIRLRKKS